MKPLFILAVGIGVNLGAGIWSAINQLPTSLTFLLLLTAAVLSFALVGFCRKKSLASKHDATPETVAANTFTGEPVA